MKGKLILALGGSRSGKSEFAEQYAGTMGGPVIYIATAGFQDAEMAERIRLHRARRPASWKTVEEEIDILSVLEKGHSGEVFLLDCATVWLTNLLLDDNLPWKGSTAAEKNSFILGQVRRLTGMVESGSHLIIVSNEVGLGLVPEYPLGRTFRDLAGKMNQILAAKADEVFFTVAGLPLEIKSMVRVEWRE